jgi:hypothetical protein
MFDLRKGTVQTAPEKDGPIFAVSRRPEKLTLRTHPLFAPFGAQNRYVSSKCIGREKFPGWLAERSQFELSGPFERELVFLRQRISLAFVPLTCLEGNGESKADRDSRENGPEKATFGHFSLPSR